MTLGEKLKQARLEKGMSQRELCGEEITRNMLSLIENGTARPSMDTLFYLAGRLGKKISWFLDEDAVTSPNQERMARARNAWQSSDFGQADALLGEYAGPDPVFDREWELLTALVRLELAEKALEQNKPLYAAELLESIRLSDGAYCRGELDRRRLLLLAGARPEKAAQICRRLPPLEEELVLRAAAALEEGQLDRAEALLESAEERSEAWQLLRGEAYRSRKDYARAAECFHRAEARFPEKTAPLLEQCYRELEDYKMAYFYACRQKSDS